MRLFCFWYNTAIARLYQKVFVNKKRLSNEAVIEDRSELPPQLAKSRRPKWQLAYRIRPSKKEHAGHSKPNANNRQSVADFHLCLLSR